MLEIGKINGVHCVQGDISEEATQEKVSQLLDFQKADLVCSDAVPDFIGERFVDHIRASSLNKEIINFCNLVLKPGGKLLMKIIQGPVDKDLVEYAELHFKSVQKVKPQASRNESAETYVLCIGYN